MVFFGVKITHFYPFFVMISPCFVRISVRFVGEILFLSRRKILYLFKKWWSASKFMAVC